MRPQIIGGYVLLGLLSAAIVFATAAVVKQGPRHRSHTHVRVTHGCVSVGCAQLGDKFSIVLDGQVTQVSSPQPGVTCVQVQSRTHAGDYCAASG